MKYYEAHDQAYRQRLKAGHVAWDAGAYEDFDMLPMVQESLKGFTVASPATAALDLGCGTGALAVFLARRGFDVTAVDVSSAAIEEARKQAALRDTEVKFHVADVCGMNFPDASFDLITDNHFLHCIVFAEERAGVLSRVHALLKPGGQYWIETMVGHPGMKPRPEWNIDGEGITWAVWDGERELAGSVKKGGETWAPIRRIQNTSEMLADELRRAGFEILWQETAPPKDENDTGCFRARCGK